MSDKKQSTKTCPDCGDTMIGLSSVDEKICASCAKVVKWELEEGQEYVLK